MFGTGNVGAARKLPRARSLLVIAAVGLLAGGCSTQMESAQALLTAAQAPSFTEATTPPVEDGRSALQKATEYWGKAYAKDPRDAKTAINYAKNLKALGEKQQALAVLQQTSVYHGTNRALNAEYGRLALEFDQVSLAQKLLEQADDPANPDWRVISARGTVLAKQGIYKDAIAHYQRALTLSPNEPSVMNNLAMAYVALGEPDKAEPLLKRAAAAGGQDGRVTQNLALALSLQGKYDEAKIAGARDQSPDNAAANVDYVRSIVNLEAKPLTTGTLTAAGERAPDEASGWATKVAAAKGTR
jgi:Flp pilus assembly protein TadD